MVTVVILANITPVDLIYTYSSLSMYGVKAGTSELCTYGLSNGANLEMKKVIITRLRFTGPILVRA